MKTKKTSSGIIKSVLASSALLLTAATASVNAVVLEETSTSQSVASFAAGSLEEKRPRRLIVTPNQSAQGFVSAFSASSMQKMSLSSGQKMKLVKQTALGDFVYSIPENISTAEAMADMTAKGFLVEVDRWMYPMFTPNDSRYNEQWHYFESTGGLNLPSAWDITSGEGVVVAVIDTGYVSHPDLNANLLPGYDMISDAQVAQDGGGRDSDASDPGDWTNDNECVQGRPGSSSSWHGTHVAGTIAAVTNNGTGVAGAAFGAKVVPVRALGRCGGFTSDIADSIIWAAGGNVPGVPANPNPAQVLNLSLGGGGACGSTTQNAINTARSLGATVVVAAGNSNTNAANANPANCNGVVTVAATNRNGGRASYSNFGSVVDVAAPGGQQSFANDPNGILSTLNAGSRGPTSSNYEFFQGTSMATPHVAAVAALIYAVDPTVTPTEVENILKSTARSFPSTCSQCGSGIVDATAAVVAAGGGNPNPTPTPTPGGSELSNGVAKTGLSGSTGSETFFTLEVPAGATGLTFRTRGGSGDADLYVRFGSKPTTGAYDCRPWRNGNSETCDISNVRAGTYHVMIRGYSSFSGVSLVASFEGGSGPGPDPVGISESNVSGSRNAWRHFSMEVPAGASSLFAEISGGSGDADMYVRFGSQPTTSSYNCRPYRNGNSESCNISNPQAGTWFVSLRGYRAFSGVNLEASAN